MPWLDTTEPQDPSAQQWQSFLKNALLRRLQTEHLTVALRELMQLNRLSPRRIADIFMGFRAQNGGFDDPLLFGYAKLLLRTQCIGTDDLLVALLKHSKFTSRDENIGLHSHISGLPTCEERMFTVLLSLHVTGELSVSPRKVYQILAALVRWLHVVNEYETGKQLEIGPLHTVDAFSYGMYESLASLASTILRTAAIRDAPKQPWWKDRRATIVQEMGNFDLHVLQWMQSRFGGTLQALIKLPPFIETDSSGMPILSDQQILDSVTDLPIVRSRAGLYIWLHASLCGRPLTDDMSMLSYLQNRYPGDGHTLAVDLLIASFDTLTNALVCKHRQSIKLIRSFICNRVPLVLAMFAGYIAPPLTVDGCIQMAFISIPMEALEPISAGANDIREVLKTTRKECLQACALHGLVLESTIGSITREPSAPLPRVTKYTKEALLSQCTNNVGRLEGLTDDLQKMQGNAGAVAGCIVDLVNHFCMNRDTMSLKSLCNILVKKLTGMDVVMQYTQPSALILPICSLLNDWVHDQDQTEVTPSYEEFACILLFTLAMIHRYNLEKADIGLVGSDNFVFNLLQGLSTSISPSDLTEEQSEQLSKWAEGLFATDEQGDTNGIGEDVMRQCPPQAFYLLVPTLFDQSLLTCKLDRRFLPTFKGGLELLLEPFLLPSLIGGLSWLIKHSWEDHGDADLLLEVLDKLLKPSSPSSEAQTMHRAIMAIVATPLVSTLKKMGQKRPDNKNALIKLLEPFCGRQLTSHASKNDATEWAKTPGGGLERCVRSVVHDLVIWTSSVGPNHPPKYTHAMVTTACQVIGPVRVLAALIAELKEQAAIGNGSIALDVCAAMICAPVPTTTAPLLALGSSTVQGQAGQSSVREALRLTVSNCRSLLKKPQTEAEALIRLSRRVETQLAVSQVPQMPSAISTQDQAADQIMKDLGLTDADVIATATGEVGMQVDSTATLSNSATLDFATTDLAAGLDLAGASGDLANLSSDAGAMQMGQSQNFFNDLNMDIGMTQQAQQESMQDLDGVGIPSDAANNDSNQEEDIFAGLDMDLGEDFTFS